jgi:hypothetical protein
MHRASCSSVADKNTRVHSKVPGLSRQRNKQQQQQQQQTLVEKQHKGLLTYSLTYILTPWCRILFEKLIVTQLIRKYPAFFMEH